MPTQLLPDQFHDDAPPWTQTVVAFLAEKERRSGSRRTVDGYARMLWPFLKRIGSPDRVTQSSGSSSGSRSRRPTTGPSRLAW